MKIINNTRMESSVTFEFDINQILKSVYAESAMRAINCEYTGKLPQMLNEDRRKMLNVIIANGYIGLCGRLMGYIAAYDMTQIEQGVLSLELRLPERAENSATILRKKIEQTLATYVLAEVYNSEPGAETLASSYRDSYIIQMRDILSPFSL